jgi:FkbM family methyltransferase
MSVRTILKSLFRSLGYEVKRRHGSSRNLPWDDPFLHLQELLRRQPVEVVFDVGANVGQTTRRFRELFPEATIHCFEPVDECFVELTRVYGSCESVKLHKKAVADTPGQRQFFRNREAPTSSLLSVSATNAIYPIDLSASLEIETVTLDRFCSENGISKIDILKMDIQGGEMMALQGASGLLNGQAIDLLLTEVWFNQVYENQAYYHDISEFLFRFGYHPYGLYDLNYSPTGLLGWGDAIYISPKIGRMLGAQQIPRKGSGS